MNKKKRILLSVIGILLLITSIIGVSYAYFSSIIVGNNEAKPTVVTTGTMKIEYENSAEITGEKLLPGWQSETKTFTVKNTGTLPVNYDIRITNVTNTFAKPDELVFKLTRDGETILEAKQFPIVDSTIIPFVEIEPNTIHTYTMQITFKELGAAQDYNQGRELAGKIEIVAIESAKTITLEGDTSNANAPVLNNGLIPVTWNGRNWVKADTTRAWYNYDNGAWANAVTVSSSSRSTYISAAANTEIPMDDIETMWVWIPRYEYDTADMGETHGYAKKCSEIKNPSPEQNPGCYSGFELIDEDKWLKQLDEYYGDGATIVRELKANGYSDAIGYAIDAIQIEMSWYEQKLQYKVGGEFLPDNYDKSRLHPGEIRINFVDRDVKIASNNDYYIHSSFTFDNEDLSGIWIAKFEMSDGDTMCSAAAHPKKECDFVSIHPHIKPNVTSWRGARIGTMWTAIHNNMNGSSNQYGLTNTDAHLMKNMEWGAVAYLSQSKYGKYGNPNYNRNEKEIYINNYNGYQTGCSAGSSTDIDSSTCEYTYNVEKQGTGASTTGNIYGIYDMSGGAKEYVMGIMKDPTNTEPQVGGELLNSGWSGKCYPGREYVGDYGYLKNLGSKYYDLYEYSSNASDVTRYHKGDATYEVTESFTLNSGFSSGWYSDDAYFVGSYSPFFVRGGHSSYTVASGIFGFSSDEGNSDMYNGGRPALVPLNQ